MSGPPLFRLSHSKIQAFNRCRKSYWFRYLSGEPWPADTPNPAGCVGTGIHRAMKALCDTGDPDDGANALDVYLRMPAHECAGPGTDAYRSAFEMFARGREAHASIESEDRWAEIDTWAPWPSRGITVSARIDRADRMAGSAWQIIDWKTGSVDMDEITDAQLDLGHIALRIGRQLEGDASVTAVAWNLRSGQQRVRALRRGDALATMQRLANLADRMQSVTTFEATPGPFCRFCEWRPRCAEAETVESVGWDAEETDQTDRQWRDEGL
jgi:RecB family exonuclease